MQCRQVGNRIEIAPNFNLLTIKSDGKFVRSLEDAKWHGFDEPFRKIWTVLDTPDTRVELRARGHLVAPGTRDFFDMLADLDTLIESLDFVDFLV